MISDHASNGQVVGFMGSVMRVPLSNWIEYGSGKTIISLFRQGTAQKSLICVEKDFSDSHTVGIIVQNVRLDTHRWVPIWKL